MEKNVKVAIIGAGKIGKVHIDALSKLKADAEVVSVSDVDESRGQALASVAGAKYFNNYLDALNQQPDLAIICLPHGLHKAAGIACAQAGVSMLMEKPIANTLEDAVEIVEEVKKNKVHMALSFVHRYRAELQHARALIDAGKLGRLFTASDVFTMNGGHHLPGWVWNKELSGGGVMMYSGIHSIDWLCWLMGSRVERLIANGCSYNDTANDEMEANVLLYFENGTTGSIIGRQPPYAVAQRTRDTEIIGDKGRIRFRCGETLEFSSETQAYGIKMQNDNPFIAQARELIAMVREDRDPWINHRDGLRAQSILSAMYESMETGEMTKVKYYDL